MVVSQQVQHAVHDEQRQLVRQRVACLARLAGRHRRADDDIADEQRRVSGRHGAAGAPGAHLHRECQDVGRMVALKPVGCQLGDLGLVHERQTQFGGAPDPFAVGDRCRQQTPPVEVQVLPPGTGVEGAPVRHLHGHRSVHDPPAVLRVLPPVPGGGRAPVTRRVRRPVLGHPDRPRAGSPPVSLLALS